MWIKIPGKSRVVPVLALTLALTILSAAPSLAGSKGEEAPSPAPTATAAPAAPAPESEISFNGKVFCSLKRRVDLPFRGTITSLLVRSGDRVEPGQVLARYRPSPEALVLIRQRLAPAQISDNKVKLAETERNLTPLQAKKQELTKLLQKKLAPPQSLEQVNRDLRLLEQERATLQAQLRQDQQTYRDDLALLKKQLGNGVSSGKIPPEATLTAPIGGYIIWINSELREGAELEPTPGVFQVGMMNPMLVRAQAFEIEALQIKPGETAEVTLESLPGQKFQGEVSRISWASQTPGLDQPAYYDVELTVPNPKMELKDGLKAQIVFRKNR
ncbi:MAG: efflux RND transporter periplasmic adaptor subunit [Deltaproteobacteria bacterium]|nr:efflux RND transporter periplasmic adaptor subunit [Deltaproteobacteria bacterium]